MCPPNPDASLSWVVGGSFSGLQKLRTSLTSACSWCVDVIFHQCMEGASTLVVLLEENKTTPCSLSQLWFKTHLQSSGCGRIHSTGGVIYLPLYQTSLWCLSLIPLLSFTVTWAEQRLWVVEKVLPAGSISTKSVQQCVGPG